MSGHVHSAISAGRESSFDSHCATVDRILFEAEDGGTVILKDQDNGTVKCDMGSGEIEVGQTYRFLGQWIVDKKYGRQFLASTFMLDSDGSKEGTIEYLIKTCPGIGSVRARKIWDQCLGNSIKWLREHPEDFVEEGILTEDIAKDAAFCLRRDEKFQRVKIDLFALLGGRGFGSRTMRACIARWGNSAAARIARNPWLLLLHEIPGAGWIRVDKLYLDRGGDRGALKRQTIAGWYAVREADNGSTWLRHAVFRNGVLKAVGSQAARHDDAIELAFRSKLVEVSQDFEPGGYLADPANAYAERCLARSVGRLMIAAPGEWPILTEPDVSAHQAAAVNENSHSSIMILTGPPGTGKTRTAAVLLRNLAAAIGRGQIDVCAPTGKAAIRIQDAMQANGLHVKATTIHGLLRVDPLCSRPGEWKFMHDENNPLGSMCVAIDEFSMCDTSLANSLFRACRPGTRILIIGDTGQLPPVGSGAPLRDLLAAGIPEARLSEIQRNSGLITTGCAALRDGRLPRFAVRPNAEKGDNIVMLESDDPLQSRNLIEQVLGLLRGKTTVSALWDCQVLTPLNERGLLSRKSLNDFLQPLLNPFQPSDPVGHQKTFRLRDKIICLKNQSQLTWSCEPKSQTCFVENWLPDEPDLLKHNEAWIANGEIGQVMAVSERKNEVIVQFDAPSRFIKIDAPRRIQHEDGTDSAREDGFALAFAISYHKSQGSEWPYVIGIIDPAASRIASRELIYTCISRAKRLCFLVGSKQVLSKQIRRAELPERKTFLKELIEQELRKG
jgi:exodeoxyribonuclease V alpha subunit